MESNGICFQRNNEDRSSNEAPRVLNGFLFVYISGPCCVPRTAQVYSRLAQVRVAAAQAPNAKLGPANKTV